MPAECEGFSQRTHWTVALASFYSLFPLPTFRNLKKTHRWHPNCLSISNNTDGPMGEVEFMSLADLSKLEKIMLVCAARCDEVEKCLRSVGCPVVKLRSGEAAISRARRENFDVAVLVSTGKAMDLAETVLNLRDVNRSLQIVVVTEREIVKKNDFLAKTLIAHPVPGTQLLTVAQLERQFMALSASERHERGLVSH
jgi:hypothetical protein